MNKEKILNTKDNPFIVSSLEDCYFDKDKIRIKAKYVQFVCEKCGKIEIKRDVSIDSIVKNKLPFWCGPCFRKAGTLKNHGSETWNNQDKIKQTNLKKYGVDNVFKAKEIKDKIKDKVTKKYGGFTWASKELREKANQTSIKRYGSSNNIEKAKQTNLLKYGGTSPAHSEKVKEKQKCTLRKKYGNNYENMPGPLASKQKFINLRKEQSQKLDLTWLDENNFNGKYNKNGPIYYHFRCNICSTEFLDDFHSGLPICRKCHPKLSGISYQEKEIVNYIRSIYNGLIIENDRKIISPKELDIYLPELKLAIEYNGSYWHGYRKDSQCSLSEFKQKSEWKRLECQKLGIRLITIDECDYTNRPEVFKRFLCDQILPRKRIFARNCEIKEIKDTKKAKEFCEYYHVNGFRGGQYKYGLYYEDELLIVAIFAKYRDAFECTRLCYKTGYDVIGGWAKIQKHFGKRFLHYVNLKYFPGTNVTKCGYRFLLNGIVLHRNALQKNTGLYRHCSIIDPNVSDFQNCLLNDGIAIFDLGNDVRWYN
jgi:predicted RNA-binding Zn-ribbon protein involved in translation (DUF1610 family)